MPILPTSRTLLSLPPDTPDADAYRLDQVIAEHGAAGLLAQVDALERIRRVLDGDELGSLVADASRTAKPQRRGFGRADGNTCGQIIPKTGSPCARPAPPGKQCHYHRPPYFNAGSQPLKVELPASPAAEPTDEPDAAAPYDGAQAPDTPAPAVEDNPDAAVETDAPQRVCGKCQAAGPALTVCRSASAEGEDWALRCQVCGWRKPL